jgi:hypothetical protein
MAVESLSNVQDPLWGALVRLAINVTTLYIIVCLVYPRFTKRRDHMFPFFLMGIMIFTICILLKKVELQMGMALGLFAIFSIMRFRTENLLTKSMAYLFTVTGISVVNALFDYPHPVRGTIVVNLVVILAVLLLEIYFNKFWKEEENIAEIKASKTGHKKADIKPERPKPLNRYEVLYDNLKLVNPDLMPELIKDISKRIGKNIERIEIRKVDLIKKNAVLEVFFKQKAS